jgi:hypothetical protein
VSCNLLNGRGRKLESVARWYFGNLRIINFEMRIIIKIEASFDRGDISKKQSTPFDRASLKVQSINFSKVLMNVVLVVLSCAMRSSALIYYGPWG